MGTERVCRSRNPAPRGKGHVESPGSASAPQKPSERTRAHQGAVGAPRRNGTVEPCGDDDCGCLDDMATRWSETELELSTSFERDAMPLLDPLYTCALRMTHNRSDAEDLLQETMLTGYAGFQSFQTGTNLRAWLFRIMTDTWISSQHGAQRLEAELADTEIAGVHRHSSSEVCKAEADVLTALPDDVVVEVLMALPERFRMVIHFAYVEDLRYRDIAEIMQTPVGTVASRLSRARTQFRTLLAGVAVELGSARVDRATTMRNDIVVRELARAVGGQGRLCERPRTNADRDDAVTVSTSPQQDG